MLSAPGLRTIGSGAPATWITCAQCGDPVLQLGAGETVYPARSAGALLPGTRTRHVGVVCNGCGNEFGLTILSRAGGS